MAVGSQAPDFTLKDQNNEDVTLGSFQGDRNELVVFHPLAFSGVCTDELCQLRDDLDQFRTVVRFAETNQPGEARDQGVWKQALAALPT